MENSVVNSINFDDIPFFNGAKGFATIYLNGEFHLFFPYSTYSKGWIMHYVSADGYVWEQLDAAVFVKKPIDSVTAFTQKGKIYLYYLTKGLFGKNDLQLAISKDAESFLTFPNALIKNTKLRDIKCFYSDGMRYVIGSEIDNDTIPTYVSFDGIEWQKGDIKHVMDEQEMAKYLGAPSPFVAYDKSYIAYSMCGTHIARAEFELESTNTLKVQESVQSMGAETIRSTMLGEGNPLLFAGLGSSIVAIESYPTEQGIGLRLYREMLKCVRRIVDQGVEEGKPHPTEWMRERNIFHLFTLPKQASVELNIGDTKITISEQEEVILGEEVLCSNEDKVEISILDMGSMVVVEVCDRVYPIATIGGTIKVDGTVDFSHECYKIMR